MADVLISSELLVDDVQIDSGLNSSSIDIDADIGSTTIIQTEAVKAYATEEEDGVLLTVIDFYGTTTGLVHNGEKGDTGNTGATGAAAGFGSVTASVDSNVGTPSVEVSTSGADTAKNFSFAFHNIKGDKGDTGSTGAAAGFGTVTATVDANVGTPSVEVSTSGTDTAKNFAFAFHNLKGADGVGDVSSVQGATGDVVLDIAYDEQSSVGLAEVGTAITSEPNYTPTGRVEQTLESVEFMTGATGILNASCSNATLYLGFSLTPTKTTKTIPTSAAVFNGNGVNLIIKERQ